MGTETSIGIAVAFLAGLLSFLSPCVLPLVPSYISFITGLSLEELETRRRVALTHAILFVGGFSAIFLALGASATQLGRLLNAQQVWLERVGGLLVIVFGLYLLGVLRLAGLARERRVHLETKPLGYLGSFFVGLAFGAGWTPCIGPILGAILTYTAVESRLGEGLGLLAAYSLGLAVPFLVAAVALDRFLEWFKGFRRFLPLTSKLAGGILLVVGLLLVTGYFSLLAGWLQGLTPDFLRERL